MDIGTSLHLIHDTFDYVSAKRTRDPIAVQSGKRFKNALIYSAFTHLAKTKRNPLGMMYIVRTLEGYNAHVSHEIHTGLVLNEFEQAVERFVHTSRGIRKFGRDNLLDKLAKDPSRIFDPSMNLIHDSGLCHVGYLGVCEHFGWNPDSVTFKQVHEEAVLEPRLLAPAFHLLCK